MAVTPICAVVISIRHSVGKPDNKKPWSFDQGFLLTTAKLVFHVKTLPFELYANSAAHWHFDVFPVHVFNLCMCLPTF